MFKKILIANRGEIAVRILQTLKRMQISSVVVYSEADCRSRAVLEADEAICIGEAPVKSSYLNIDRIIEVAKETGAEAIHPGYGLLSENADFATACERKGITFLGPTPDQIRMFGLKHEARVLAHEAEVPLVPGSDLLNDVDEAIFVAQEIGYPVMLKITAGGGGIGMHLCQDQAQLEKSWNTVERLGQNNFGNSGIFLEKYIENARHIEVQIFGDGEGNVITLGERDCSVQRRNQKVIEETPAPEITDTLRENLYAAARRLGESIDYRSAGTVEFLYDKRTNEFYFLEVNTRLQVEHRVTEAVFGIDLVQWMIEVGCGSLPAFDSLDLNSQGHSIQIRVYAENPLLDFQPSTGQITHLTLPEDVWVDTWIENGSEITPYYDPLIIKLIVHAEDREDAIQKMLQAIRKTCVTGIECNLEYLYAIIDGVDFRNVTHSTRFLNDFEFVSKSIEVIEGGTQTTIQDYPGRTGYWDVGVPPSGPMDSLAPRIANQLLGNKTNASVLEILMSGPTLKFNCGTWICLTGAKMKTDLDGGQAVPFWKPVHLKAGETLHIGEIEEEGARAYLAVVGGFDVPKYLGSSSTFTLGNFGGYTGQALQFGDFLKLHLTVDKDKTQSLRSIDPLFIPTYTECMEIAVLYGPHGAPDFFKKEDIDAFFDAEWEVHYNSARTGVRLIGPKPNWAREDGGEAGLHPSNIHDNAYAVGSIDFTGDMPIILGPDGPSLGGFVCPATIATGDLWKMGQLRPGMKVKFKKISLDAANQLETEHESLVDSLETLVAIPSVSPDYSPILDSVPCSREQPFHACYRLSGDRNILIEYGAMVLDLNLRFRVHALQQHIQTLGIRGVLDLTPGIRSLQVHFDSKIISARELLGLLKEAEASLPNINSMEVPYRKVYLPLSWDDESTRLAIRKYEHGVRKNAPWCPSNIEFIRRINGLDSVEDVKNILFNANYMVLGLGDVYLGAPVATPIDPRHRLVTTKYNPARTWTPENAVGIGGAYLCVYGMEGPGGYQFVGRTLQMWNRFRSTRDFESGKPWLLRFFDQIRFFPVKHDELTQIRKDFLHGKYDLKVEEKVFKLADYHQFMDDNRSSISEFKSRQQNAFESERLAWAESGQDSFDTTANDLPPQVDEKTVPDGCVELKSTMPGSIWKCCFNEGDIVEVDEAVYILEAMKMEVVIKSTCKAILVKMFGKEGQTIAKGQPLAWIKPLV